MFEIKKENKTEDVLLRSLWLIINELKDITEFKTNELKSLSFLQTDKYMQEILRFYVKNKKHVKRKHAREILEALEKISTAIANSVQYEGGVIPVDLRNLR